MTKTESTYAHLQFLFHTQHTQSVIHVPPNGLAVWASRKEAQHLATVDGELMRERNGGGVDWGPFLA